MGYSIIIEPGALHDIQNAIDYYDEQQIGLGEKFEAVLNKHFGSLEKNPFFQVRYDQVHCLPINKYPYMVHYTINEKEKTLTVRAVFHTSMNPDNWKIRKM
jgi:toxin ParE1/3/4